MGGNPAPRRVPGQAGGRAAPADYDSGAMDAPRPIFIHGAGADPGVWSRQEPRFEGSASLALPGHPLGEVARSVEAAAEWVAGALEEIEPPYVLVGHSLGAAVVLETAIAHGDRVDGVVAIGGGARLPVDPRLLEGARTDFPGTSRRIAAASFVDGEGPVVDELAETIARSGQETLVADLEACAAFDVRGRLGAVRVPVLVIVGGADRMTPPALSEELTRGLPQATMVVVPEAGHMVMCEQAGAVDLLIAAQLARHEASGGG